ncbi:hypothetical protein HNQ79_003469 [Streptomyces candidus]|uniref:Uncharacterized protein n=1 Tax=Streptomyces candidus TaxID=67283 RepID=A0A7X0LR07_9ACTN|nr:hypothetical protein [Streptomyces candidus]
METVEAVPGTAVTCAAHESAARTTPVPPSAPAACPVRAASHTTAQHRPTPECSPAPRFRSAHEPAAAPAASAPVSAAHADPAHALPWGPVAGGSAEPLDLVTVPARQGLEAVDILRRAAAGAAGSGTPGAPPAGVGPVLHDGPCDTLGFLVPPGTADCWDLPGSACTQTLGRGTSFAADAPDLPEYDPVTTLPSRETAARVVPQPPVTGTGWLLPPTDTGPVTDPAILRRALDQAARLIEAADRCR